MSLVLWHIARERLSEFSGLQVVSSEEGTFTGGELLAASEELASLLSRAGLNEGSVVCCALPNSLAFVPALLALCKLSSSIALTSPKYGVDELRTIVDVIHPRSILTTSAFLKTCSESFEIQTTATLSLKNLPTELLLITIRDSTVSNISVDTALIKFTSGSTGKLKAIPLSMENILAECNNIASSLSITEHDGIVAPVPLCHSYGFDLGVLVMLFTGASLLVRESFVPRKMLKDIALKKNTIVLGVPIMYRYMTEAHVTALPDLSHLRYLLSCTAPLRPETIVSFYKKYHVPICQHYGSSEMGAVVTHVPAQVMEKLESVGLPMKNIRVSIVDDHGHEQTPGKEGEIVVASNAMAKSYVGWNPNQRSPFRDGRFWTGDIGRMDDTGYLSLYGRMDGRINVAGFKVSPQEVVIALERFPAIREAAVLGVKDGMGEEIVYAVVAVNDIVTEKEILDHCRRHLADYKVPRRIEIRDELPHGPSGKIRIRREDLNA